VPHDYAVATAEERSDLRDLTNRMTASAWPEFMHHDPVAHRHWGDLFERFPGYQFALFGPSGESVAVGLSVPLTYDPRREGYPDEGWDWAIARGVADGAAGRRPSIQCGLMVVVPEAHRGRGVSAQAIRAMQDIGIRRGLREMIVPVRPTLKSSYPLTPVDRYVQWRNAEGLPIDPWLRTHARLGGEIVGVCSRSMTISGAIAEWETWTGMRFPESGPYIVPGALVPVEIDRESDWGLYVEPNVWVRHAAGER
jgi:GNAT superfamily N-acetyltransferase